MKEIEKNDPDELLEVIEEEQKLPDEESLSFLRDPRLFFNIINEFNKKIEGEEKSKKAIFLSLCSVWVKGSEVPLNTLVSSESSAGKSFVCKNVIKIFPEDIVEYRTKITPEAFTYWKRGDANWDWDGKICYLEDISQSLLDSPTFKVMCSEGSTATIVIRQRAVDIRIRGKPVMLVTTARTNPNSEILNRFQIVSLDESDKQTKAIVFRQARQQGQEIYDPRIISALSQLKRREVFIPYANSIAEFLNENYTFDSIRLRRDFSRLLDLIKCSASLYQFQRTESEGNLIANEEDYKIARECINYIQTQTFKGLTHKLKKAYDCCIQIKEFSAKEIHSRFPFVNQKMWYNYLDQLLERGLLKTELRKTEESNKQVTFYKVIENKIFELPEFSFLPESVTNVTLVTNIQDNCNKCNNFTEKEQDDFSELKIKEVLENE